MVADFVFIALEAPRIFVFQISNHQFMEISTSHSAVIRHVLASCSLSSNCYVAVVIFVMIDGYPR